MTYEFVLDYWEVYLLVLVRITSFVYTAPFFNTSNTPQRVKLGFSIFLSYLIFCLLPDTSLEYAGIAGYAMLIVKESVVGLLLGFTSNICIMSIQFAGNIIDTNIGLSMATMYDPQTQSTVNLSGNLYYYFIFLILLVSDMYQFLVSAIADTYTIISIGGMTIRASLYDSVLGIVADYFIIGFRIALPVFATIMIVNVVLGILAKVAPQMNMFAVGIQIKLSAGFVIMYLTVSMLPAVANFLIEQIKSVILTVAGGLS